MFRQMALFALALAVVVMALWMFPRRSAMAAVSKDSETYARTLEFCKEQFPKFHDRVISNLNAFYAEYKKSFDAALCTAGRLEVMHLHKSRVLKNLREIDQRMFNDERARIALHEARRNLDHIMRVHIEEARARCGLPLVTLEPIDDFHHVHFARASNDDL